MIIFSFKKIFVIDNCLLYVVSKMYYNPTLSENSTFSAPPISISSSYLPVFSKKSLLTVNNPPAMAGVLHIHRYTIIRHCAYMHKHVRSQNKYI